MRYLRYRLQTHMRYLRRCFILGIANAFHITHLHITFRTWHAVQRERVTEKRVVGGLICFSLAVWAREGGSESIVAISAV